MECMDEPLYVTKGREYQRQYYLKNREKKLVYAKQNRERQNQLRREKRIRDGLAIRDKTGIPTEDKQEYNRLYHLERRAEKQLRNKIRSLQAVSCSTQPKCQKCGESDIRVLHINHINGGGSKEHKELKAHGLRKAIIEGKRDTVDLNVLCANCNTLFEYERGRVRVPRNYLAILAEEIG